MARTNELRRDAFIRSVRPDPKNTEALVLLQGYIGDSDLEGQLRLYADPSLNEFIDLPESDVLYADPVPPEEDRLGGSRLWVKKTTVFTSGDPQHANRIKSSFLEGDLLQAYGGQAPGSNPVARAANLPSAFLQQGCRPYTEPFEVCNVYTNQPWCKLVDPTDRFTFQHPSCTPTCAHAPCFPPPSRHPFGLCISLQRVNCEIGFRQAVTIACPGAFIGGFDPYQTGY